MIIHKVEVSNEWMERVKKSWADVAEYDENDLVIVEVRGSHAESIGIALVPREFAKTYTDDDNWTYTIKEIEVREATNE